MKKRTTTEVACLKCDRTDRPYHAKGLCKACYVRQFRAKHKKVLSVDNSRLT